MELGWKGVQCKKKGVTRVDWCDKMDWCEASWSSEPIGKRSREYKRAACTEEAAVMFGWPCYNLVITDYMLNLRKK